MSTTLALAAGGWGVLMALAPLLQVRQIVRRRSSADVSLGYLAVLLVGFALWLAYGASIGNVPLVVTNVASLVAATTTVATVLRYRPRSDAPTA